jgi:alginate O-acetyltransferase complex protein AlgI
MLFNSLNFAVFIPVVFFLYWLMQKGGLKMQNTLLLIASFFFYACWDFRFLFLLFFSILLDYTTGLKMQKANTSTKKRNWFWLSIVINLGFLAIFKYYNFFASSFADGLSLAGVKVNPLLLNIILPVGISFYTFHGLSYVIDIYNNRIKAEKNFIDYALFVSFFPLLVAGPIERATHLLPQIKTKRYFDSEKAADGLRQILWGLFKKMVIADNCAAFANNIFNNYTHYNGSTLFIGAVFFAIQIYCDFSGYSDIALGTARLFGIELLQNFSFPYFSRDIAEFWRRWHISLSSWFRDYLYIPLGGSKGGQWVTVRNVFIIFIVSGFWHGANFTFIVWGFLNALFILPSVLYKTNRTNIDIVAKGKIFPSVKDAVSIVITFTLTTIAWIFFRAENIGIALKYVSVVLSKSFFTMPVGSTFAGDPMVSIYLMVPLIVMFFCIEWLGREGTFALAKMSYRFPLVIRWIFYVTIIALIYYFNPDKKQQFIYFQF